MSIRCLKKGVIGSKSKKPWQVVSHPRNSPSSTSVTIWKRPFLPKNKPLKMLRMQLEVIRKVRKTKQRTKVRRVARVRRAAVMVTISQKVLRLVPLSASRSLMIFM